MGVMNEWARNRKRIILAIVLFALVVLVGIPLYFLFYQKPTCFDRTQNGDETGVDCGGSCQLLCSAESLPLIARGDPRVLTIATSTFEVVALLDNPNPTAVIERAKYTLKVFDLASAIPVKTIEGEIYVPKGEEFAIFAGPFTLEAGIVPTRATLEWQKESLIWQKDALEAPEVDVVDKALSKEDTVPRLDATVENNSLEEAKNLDFVALISDENGNIFAASKTFIEYIGAGEEVPIIFTWPRPFNAKAAQITIITRLLPDRSFK
jgi:hypothetical protein